MNINKKTDTSTTPASRGGNTRTVMRYLALGFGVALIIMLLGLDLYLLGATLVNRWMLFGLTALIGVATAIPAAERWRRITGWRWTIANCLLHTVVVTVAVVTIFLSVNYWAAPASRFEQRQAVVEAKVRSKRHQTKRVGRRYYRQGPAYYVYSLNVRFIDPGLGDHSVPVAKSKYDAVGQGDTVVMEVGRGALGFYVIDESTTQPLHKRRKSHKFRHKRPVYRPTHEDKGN